MKQYLVTAAEMKRYDAATIEKHQIPSLVLMERAALATVEELQRERGAAPCRVLVAAGCGNNGGDGLAAGRLLMAEGYTVTFVLLGDASRCSAETSRQLSILRSYGAEIYSTIPENEYDIVIDAVFGIGLSRPVQGVCRDAIERINGCGGYVCSVDIPSGIDADTGRVMGCAVRADLTVAYGFRKRGHVLYPGASYTGKLRCRGMGVDEGSFYGCPPALYMLAGEIGAFLPQRRPDGNKGTFGKALVIAGSANAAGAGLMAAKGAFCAGAGMVRLVTDAVNRDAALQYVPEAMLLTYPSGGSPERQDGAWDAAGVTEAFLTELAAAERWADCLLIGPGLGKDENARRLLRFAVERSALPLVADADALNLLAEDETLLNRLAQGALEGRAVILTPHPGEFARLYGCAAAEVREHLTAYPRLLADRLHCTVVCKDARTAVMCPGAEEGYLNTTGNAGMATAGTGDVLAGMITGLLAQGLSAAQAAVAGVYLHGAAGDLAAGDKGQASMTATDLIGRIGEAMEAASGSTQALRNEESCQ